MSHTTQNINIDNLSDKQLANMIAKYRSDPLTNIEGLWCCEWSGRNLVHRRQRGESCCGCGCGGTAWVPDNYSHYCGDGKWELSCPKCAKQKAVVEEGGEERFHAPPPAPISGPYCGFCNNQLINSLEVELYVKNCERYFKIVKDINK